MENSFLSGNLFTLGVDPNTRDHFSSAAKWARIIAIVNFISAGLSLISVFTTKEDQGTQTAMFIFLLIFAGISIALNIFLLRFGNNMTKSLSTMSQEQFNEGVGSLNTYFKIMGILIIVILSLMLIGMLFFIIGVGMRG